MRWMSAPGNESTAHVKVVVLNSKISPSCGHDTKDSISGPSGKGKKSLMKKKSRELIIYGMLTVDSKTEDSMLVWLVSIGSFTIVITIL
jgi:hypothetical protein